MARTKKAPVAGGNEPLVTYLTGLKTDPQRAWARATLARFVETGDNKVDYSVDPLGQASFEKIDAEILRLVQDAIKRAPCDSCQAPRMVLQGPEAEGGPLRLLCGACGHRQELIATFAAWVPLWSVVYPAHPSSGVPAPAGVYPTTTTTTEYPRYVLDEAEGPICPVPACHGNPLAEDPGRKKAGQSPVFPGLLHCSQCDRSWAEDEALPTADETGEMEESPASPGLSPRQDYELDYSHGDPEQARLMLARALDMDPTAPMPPPTIAAKALIRWGDDAPVMLGNYAAARVAVNALTLAVMQHTQQQNAALLGFLDRLPLWSRELAERLIAWVVADRPMEPSDWQGRQMTEAQSNALVADLCGYLEPDHAAKLIAHYNLEDSATPIAPRQHEPADQDGPPRPAYTPPEVAIAERNGYRFKKVPRTKPGTIVAAKCSKCHQTFTTERDGQARCPACEAVYTAPADPALEHQYTEDLRTAAAEGTPLRNIAIPADIPPGRATQLIDLVAAAHHIDPNVRDATRFLVPHIWPTATTAAATRAWIDSLTSGKRWAQAKYDHCVHGDTDPGYKQTVEKLYYEIDRRLGGIAADGASAIIVPPPEAFALPRVDWKGRASTAQTPTERARRACVAYLHNGLNPKKHPFGEAVIAWLADPTTEAPNPSAYAQKGGPTLDALLIVYEALTSTWTRVSGQPVPAPGVAVPLDDTERHMTRLDGSKYRWSQAKATGDQAAITRAMDEYAAIFFAGAPSPKSKKGTRHR